MPPATKAPPLTRVIAPQDGSGLAARSLPHAVAIARASGVGLLLYSQLYPSEVDGDPERSERAEVLRSLADAITEVPVEVRVEVAASPIAGLEALTLADEGALVCLSSHGRAAERGGPALGSVAEAALGRLSGPLLLVGPSCEEDRTPIAGEVVACVDCSELSEEILDPAATWARRFGMALRLLEIVPERWAQQVTAGAEDADAGDCGHTPGCPRGYTERLAEQLRDAQLTVHSDALPAPDPSQPVPHIVAALRERGAGLAALSTHGRTGLRRLRIGSTAITVVRESPCPVLVARPRSLQP